MREEECRSLQYIEKILDILLNLDTQGYGIYGAQTAGSECAFAKKTSSYDRRIPSCTI